MTLINIERKELNIVSDSDVDKIGNKIKLKSSSIANARINVQNIPIISNTIANNENFEENSQQYNLKPEIINFEYIMNGESKPINLKEKMINGMRKHSREMFNIEQPIEQKPVNVDELSFEENQSDVSEQKESSNVIESVADSISENNVSIENQDNLNEQVEQVPTAVSTPKAVTEFDINTKFNEISDIRRQVESIREEANKALQAANKSDEDLKQLSAENDRIVTELKNAEIRSLEIDSKLIETLKKQSDILSENRVKYEKTLFESNNRKEANESEINELKTKNAEVNSRLLEYQNLIKTKLQIMEAMQEFENDNSHSIEEEVKKVA